MPLSCQETHSLIKIQCHFHPVSCFCITHPFISYFTNFLKNVHYFFLFFLLHETWSYQKSKPFWTRLFCHSSPSVTNLQLCYKHYLGFILIVIYCDKIVFTKVVGLEERDNVARLGNKKTVKVWFIQIIEMTSFGDKTESENIWWT